MRTIINKHINETGGRYTNYHGPERKEIGQRKWDLLAHKALMEELRKKEAERKRAFEESEEGKIFMSLQHKKQEITINRAKTAKSLYDPMILDKNLIVNDLKNILTEDSSVEEIATALKDVNSSLEYFTTTYNQIKQDLTKFDFEPTFLFFKEMAKYNPGFLAFAPAEVLVLAEHHLSRLPEETFNAIRKRYEDLGLLQDEKVKKYYLTALKIEKPVKDMTLEEAQKFCKNNPEAYLELNQDVKELLKEELNFRKWCKFAPKTIRYFSKAELNRLATLITGFGGYIVKNPEVLENENFDNDFFLKHDVALTFQSRCTKKELADAFADYMDRFPIVERYCSIKSIVRTVGSEYNPKTDLNT